MRLIDADALKGMDIKIGHIGEKTVRAIQWATVDAFYRNIGKSPTVDAVPVVRGEWEVAIGYDPNKKVQCQNCYKMAYEPTAYCPNCGSYNGGDKS